MAWVGPHRKNIHTWQLLQLFVSLLVIYSWVSASFPQSFLCFCATVTLPSVLCGVIESARAALTE